MSPRRIVGIVLVRNEDLLVERAVLNAARFCDEWIFCDHGSRDGTPHVLRNLSEKIPFSRYLTIHHPRESHRVLQDYAGQDCWIFGVDGDEIYDPAGLGVLRNRLLAGEFDRWWMLFGNVLHVTNLDENRRTASGHLAPPCRSMTKLYNFKAIHSWGGDCPERLHGGTPVFRQGFSAAARLNLHESVPWCRSDFRCLHLCFARRSSLDRDGVIRRNLSEKIQLHSLGGLFARFLGKQSWKKSRYSRGPVVTVDAAPFFAPGSLPG